MFSSYSASPIYLSQDLDKEREFNNMQFCSNMKWCVTLRLHTLMNALYLIHVPKRSPFPHRYENAIALKLNISLLTLIQGVIQAFFSQQTFVGSPFSYYPPFHDNNLVCTFEGCETVSDNKHSASLGNFLQVL
jgi:uncharacterized protein involved in response to NO